MPTTKLGLAQMGDTDFIPNFPAWYNAAQDIIDSAAAADIDLRSAGTLLSRPAANTVRPGRRYRDEHGTVWMSDGTSWVLDGGVRPMVIAAVSSGLSIVGDNQWYSLPLSGTTPQGGITPDDRWGMVPSGTSGTDITVPFAGRWQAFGAFDWATTPSDPQFRAYLPSGGSLPPGGQYLLGLGSSYATLAGSGVPTLLAAGTAVRFSAKHNSGGARTPASSRVGLIMLSS